MFTHTGLAAAEEQMARLKAEMDDQRGTPATAAHSTGPDATADASSADGVGATAKHRRGRPRKSTAAMSPMSTAAAGDDDNIMNA